ncbi:helix-turn-helix domain-containing protein [Planobispora longispora]|uniref:helix-turn-helix domain-containing protein n=1 Tax=Planobispora longispora TaxID=28887 RepID=UPI00194140D3
MRYTQGGGLTAQQRTKREHVRLRAAELFARGDTDAQVAKAMRVSRMSANRRRRTWARGGRAAPASKCPASVRQAYPIGEQAELLRGRFTGGFSGTSPGCVRVGWAIFRQPAGGLVSRPAERPHLIGVHPRYARYTCGICLAKNAIARECGEFYRAAVPENLNVHDCHFVGRHPASPWRIREDRSSGEDRLARRVCAGAQTRRLARRGCRSRRRKQASGRCERDRSAEYSFNHGIPPP